MAFIIPKIPKIPTVDQVPFIAKINLELQKAALKAQKYAAYISVPDVGSLLKPISKAFSIKNNTIASLSNLTSSEIQSILTTAQSAIVNQTENIQNSTSLSVVDSQGNITTSTVDNLNQDLENISNEIDNTLNLLENLENVSQQQLQEIQQLADELKNFDITKVNSRRLTITIPKMPKLPFGIIQPF